MGGETLLYKDNIIKINNFIKKLEAKYNIKPIIQNITTNGILLTKDNIDFLNKNEINVTLSYDGELYSGRSYNAIKNKHDILLDISCLSIIGTITKKNSIKDFFVNIQKFDNEYYKKNNIHMEVVDPGLILNSIKDLSDINYTLFKNDINDLFDIYEQYILNNDNNYLQENFQIINFFQKIINNIQSCNKFIGCNIGINLYAMDLTGNLYKCIHDNNEIIGNINNNYDTILKNFIISNLDMYNYYNDNCRQCYCRHWCFKHCFRATNEHICNLTKILYDVLYTRIKKIIR